MTVEEAIKRIKAYCKGVDEQEKPVSDNKDCILYDGELNRECTGVVTCSYASVKALEYAAETGSNLVISHEGMFWSHGDPTDWLQDNKTYQLKKEILEKNHITVWRCFDHLASGIPVEDGWADGAFYGLIKELNWEDLVDAETKQREYKGFFLSLTLKKPQTVKEIAEEIIRKAGLNGVPVTGDENVTVQHIYLSRHQIIGGPDTQVIKDINSGDYQCIIVGELTDYTLSEYVRDALTAGQHRAIIKMGNFNEVELGMKYCEEWMPAALENRVSVRYCSSGDTVSEYVLGK